MGIETAIMGGAAILGGLAGSEGQEATTSQSSTSEPWGPQQQYLKYGFEQGQNAVKNALANPVYQGNRVAALNPFQTGVANQTGNYALNNFGLSQDAINASSGVMGTGSQFAGNAAGLFNQYSSDPTQTILANANAYANNPYAQGLIDAASRDVTRNLYENQLPTLAKAAAGSGNTNSTRAGVESAIAQRGAADRLADISSGIRGQLFSTGLSQAQNQYNQNLQNSLAANSQLYNAYTGGLSGLGQSQNLASNFFDQGNAAGSLYQNQDQNQINADMNKFNETNQNPLSYLQQYMQLVQGNYGGTTTGTSTQSSGGGWGGAISGALGGALGGAGVMGKLGWSPFGAKAGGG